MQIQNQFYPNSVQAEYSDRISPHGDSLVHNPQSGQESIGLEDVRTSSGSDVFKSRSSYAVDGCVADNVHCECGEASADSRMILSQNHFFFVDKSVLDASFCALPCPLTSRYSLIISDGFCIADFRIAAR